MNFGIKPDDTYFNEETTARRHKYNDDPRLKSDSPVAYKVGQIGRENSKRFWENLTVERDQQELTTSCAFCDQTHTGTLEQGREWHQKHRAQHPQAKAKAKKKVHGQTMVAHSDLADNIANTRAMGGHRWE